MANFPSVDILAQGASRQGNDGIEVDYAQDGTLIRRRLGGSSTVWEFSFVAGPMDATAKSGLESHYSSEKDNYFGFTWPEDSASYSVAYRARPRFYSHAGQGSLWYAECSLAGYAS